jgi:HlyD family secretion protein
MKSTPVLDHSDQDHNVIVPISEPVRPPISEEPLPSRKPWPWGKYLAGLLILAAAVLVVKHWVIPNYFHVPQTDFILASGRIEGRQVSVAPKDIQGRVKTLFVDEGSTVTPGQLLAELESNQLVARASLAEANISNVDAQILQAKIDLNFTIKNTEASVAAAESAVGSARAHAERTRAVLAVSKLDLDRATQLFNQGLIPKSSLDQSTMTYQTSQADVEAAEKDLSHAEANRDMVLASKDGVELKRQQVRALQQTRRSVVAQLAEANANLAERKIIAPSAGTVLSRTVEVGDVVSPGSPLFVITDMNRLYVKVFVPETEIAKLKFGDPADVTIDGLPERTFHAVISKIYQQAEFTPKNVETPEERVKLVFGVELALSNDEGLLKPGMPADCTIHWK